MQSELPKISGGTNGHRQDTSATSWARLQISGKGNSEQAICSASHTNVKLLASGEIFRVSLNSTTLQERGFVSWLTSVVWIQLIFAVANRFDACLQPLPVLDPREGSVG